MPTRLDVVICTAAVRGNDKHRERCEKMKSLASAAGIPLRVCDAAKAPLTSEGGNRKTT